MTTDQRSERGREPPPRTPQVIPVVPGPGRILPGTAPPPEEYDPELTARLDALDAASDDFADALRPHNTRRGYASDWSTWETFARHFGVPVTAAVRRGVLRAYVKWLWDERGSAPATIDRRLAGLAVTLRTRHRLEIPKSATKSARELLKDLQRQEAAARRAPRGRGEAPAVTVDMLRAMVDACPDDLTGLRDRTLLLVAFVIAGRRHEVAGLSVRDLEPVGGRGMVVHVRVSKTEPRKVRVPYATDARLCAVRTWLEWKDAAGLTDPGSPALRRMHRTGSVTRAGLSPQSVGNVITNAGRRANLPVRVTGHSMRAGLITAARRAGKDRKVIAATSGHVDGSVVLDRYIREEDGWQERNNALAGLL